MSKFRGITGSSTLALLLATLVGLAACGYEERPADADDLSVSDDDVSQDVPQEERVQERVREPDAEPAGEIAEEAEEAAVLVEDALGTIREMKADPALWNLVEQQSHGILILPTYGRAAAGVGVSGGEGVLFAHENGEWSDPVFYDVGDLSVGAQIGASGGEVAMILTSPEALESFKQEDDFSLNADAGVVLVDYSEMAQASLDEEDVIFWSDTEGAFAGVALGVRGIRYDREEMRAYYEQEVTPEDVLAGNVRSPQESLIQNELSR